MVHYWIGLWVTSVLLWAVRAEVASLLQVHDGDTHLLRTHRLKGLLSCGDWHRQNACPPGFTDITEGFCQSPDCTEGECCDSTLRDAEFEAAAADMNAKSQELINEFRTEFDYDPFDIDDISISEDEREDTDLGGNIDSEADAVFQQQVEVIRAEIVTCFSETMESLQDWNDTEQAAKLEEMIAAEVNFQCQERGLLDDADPIGLEMDSDDAVFVTDQYIISELDTESMHLDFGIGNEHGPTVVEMLQVLMKSVSLRPNSLEVRVNESKLSAWNETFQIALDVCNANITQREHMQEIVEKLSDPVKLKEGAEASLVDTTNLTAYELYLEDVQDELEARLEALTAAEQELADECSKRAADINMHLIDHIMLSHHSDHCSALLLQQLPTHRDQAAEKLSNSVSLAFIFHGSMEEKMHLRHGFSVDNLTPTQHLRSRILPKHDDVCKKAHDMVRPLSSEQLATDPEVRGYLKCLCEDKHFPQLCNMHYAHVLLQIIRAGRFSARNEMVVGMPIRDRTLINSDADVTRSHHGNLTPANSDTEAAFVQSDSSTSAIVPCYHQDAQSVEICFRGLCHSTSRKNQKHADLDEGLWARQSNAVFGWFDKKGVLGKKDPIKAIEKGMELLSHIDKIGDRFETLALVSEDETIGDGLDMDLSVASGSRRSARHEKCLRVSGTACFTEKSTHLFNMEASAGFAVDQCNSGLEALVKSHMFLEFNLCLGGVFRDIADQFGFDLCLKLAEAKYWTALNNVNAWVRMPLVFPTRLQVEGNVLLAEMSSVVNDYCRTQSRMTTCSRNKWIGRGKGSYKKKVYYKCDKGAEACLTSYTSRRGHDSLGARVQVGVPFFRYNRRRRMWGSFDAGLDYRTVKRFPLLR